MIPLPYVYRLTHKESGQFYIGYRCGNSKPAEFDLGCDYFTSSKIVADLGFDNFNKEIIDEVSNSELAYHKEQILIKDSIDDPLCLNRHYVDVGNGKRHFRKAGPLSEDERIKRQKVFGSNEYRKRRSIMQSGKLHSDETKKKISQNNVGMTGQKHTEESKIKMQGPRECMKGKKFSDSHKASIKENHKGMTGKSHSDETRAKISESHRGKVMSDQARERMREAWKRRKARKYESQ